MNSKRLKIYFLLSLFLGLLGLGLPLSSQAQDNSGNPSLTRDTLPDLFLERDTVGQKKAKKKKPKKKVFYGLKTKRGYIREGVEAKESLELFFFLKKYKEPDAYVGEVYVFNYQTRKIEILDRDDVRKQAHYRILHGPYARYLGKRLVEQGVFYVGTKHARWEKFTRDSVLIGKTKYYRGWPKEARISYYDLERKKVKEVIPFENGKKTGMYYLFSEEGHVLVKGKYENGKKVGVWIDYFKNKGKRQRETQYPKTEFDSDEPVILKEWDEKGRMIVQNGKKVETGTNPQNEDPIKKQLKRKH